MINAIAKKFEFESISPLLAVKNIRRNIFKIEELIQEQLGINNLSEDSWLEAESVVFQKFPYKVNYSYDQMILLEREVMKFFPNLSHSIINSIEFPINIRAAHSCIDNEYLKGKYPTDNFHVDAIGGEPIDTLNALLYLGGDLGTYCQFYDVGEIEYGDLRNAPLEQLKDVLHKLECKNLQLNFKHKAGDLLLFDSYLPHKTVRSRSKGRGRFSIDFRFKTNDPYSNYDSLLQHAKEFEFRYRKYWYLLDDSVRNMADRYEFELEKISSIHGRGAAYRVRAEEFQHFSKLTKK